MGYTLIFHTLYEKKQDVYFEQTWFSIKDEFNIKAFKSAWHNLLKRHPILRTSFLLNNVNKPLQIVYKKSKFLWIEKDFNKMRQTIHLLLNSVGL